MRLDFHSKTVLITGINGFTGYHLAKKMKTLGLNVVGTSRVPSGESGVFTLDITSKADVLNVLSTVKPDFIIHLAAISFVGHADASEFYRVNVLGTENILQSVLELGLSPEKIIISSSANIYGNTDLDLISESVCPEPVNHYACSKLAMEKIVKNYFSELPLIISRPFNYTGVGQANHFLAPKIVDHFKSEKKDLELGNLDVFRDFSSIHFVVDAYLGLLKTEQTSEIVNICSGHSYSLHQIVEHLESVSGYKINIIVNPDFVRKDEVKRITGDNTKLLALCPELRVISLFDTLNEMYQA